MAAAGRFNACRCCNGSIVALTRLSKSLYDDSAFQTFGGDIGNSVSRLPVA
jgi:hypothetical protein